MADTVLKITDDYSSVIAQIVNPSSLTWNEQLEGTGELRFLVDVNHQDINNIVEYKKVELYTIESGDDTFLWSGYISNISNDFQYVTVTCSDEKRFLQKKIIYGAKSFSSANMNTVLNTLVTEANARNTSGLGGSLSYITNVYTTFSKDFKLGATYYQIINELAQLLNVEWTVTRNQIIFRTTIGEDKTSGASFVEFVNNPNSPNENNIAQFRSNRNGNSIVTALIGIDGGSTSSASFGTGTYGQIEGTERFNDGDLSNQTQEAVNLSGTSQAELEITANTNYINFNEVNVGDLVKIRIERGSTLTDLDESVKVIEKNVRWVNKLFEFDVKLSKLKKGVVNTQNFLAGLESRVNQLELN